MGSRLLSRADFTDAEDFENVTFDLEAVFMADAFFEFFDQALVKVYALAAAFADQVMVVFAGLDQFVAAFAVAQIDSLNQTFADQRLERAVHSGQSGGLVVFIAHAPVDVLGAGQFMDAFQNI